MSNRSMIIIYIKISSTIKKINLRFSYTFITFVYYTQRFQFTMDVDLVEVDNNIVYYYY